MFPSTSYRCPPVRARAAGPVPSRRPAVRAPESGAGPRRVLGFAKVRGRLRDPGPSSWQRDLRLSPPRQARRRRGHLRGPLARCLGGACLLPPRQPCGNDVPRPGHSPWTTWCARYQRLRCAHLMPPCSVSLSGLTPPSLSTCNFISYLRGPGAGHPLLILLDFLLLLSVQVGALA